MTILRLVSILVCTAAFALAQAPSLAPASQAALDRITAQSLKGHVSFLASDLLQGRGTPSPGLDIAAEYIAAQFRRAGLEPVAGGYFQTATMTLREPTLQGLELTANTPDGAHRIDPSVLTLQLGELPALTRAEIVKVDLRKPESLAALTPEVVRGKALITSVPALRDLTPGERTEVNQAVNRFFEQVQGSLRPALLITMDRTNSPARGAGRPRLLTDNAEVPVPVLTIHDAELLQRYDAMPLGALPYTLTLVPPAPKNTPVTLRNVVGLLPGSDPALKDTYVIVSAHYDHIGTTARGDGDRINNGANDDASGTAGVLETAAAVAAMPARPKRSVLFMCYFGEELGLVGSRYYAAHPLFPLSKTVANINVEQIGRTDDQRGQRLATAELTGFDFTDVAKTLQAAGALTGVTVTKDDQFTDQFFSRSDNQALADAGVPAHTFSVAYSFPDYHRPGDEWEKLDYDNMARITRTLAAGTLLLANAEQAPQWNSANPKTEKYRAARAKAQ